jgi:beta-phosphoglucomutase-like phosphatase (HAD superfamily)
MNPKPLKAAIFDVDGTLIDSVDFHAQAWVEAFAEFGVTVPFEKVRRQIGKGGDNLMPVFLSKTQLRTFGQELDAFRGGHFKRRYLGYLRPFAGVRPLFERLIGDGVKIALASSAKQDELQVYKKIAQIDDLLDAETSSEDAKESKPAPDIFHAALRQLRGIAKDRIVVFGDTPYDAEAAGKAGLRSIGVLCGGFAAGTLTRGGCSAIYRSPSNILVNYQTIFPAPMGDG